jgi:hypothetical protein
MEGVFKGLPLVFNLQVNVVNFLCKKLYLSHFCFFTNFSLVSSCWMIVATIWKAIIVEGTNSKW